MSVVHCPSCNGNNRADWHTCYHCNQPLSNRGARIADDPPATPSEDNTDPGFEPTTVYSPAGPVELPRCFLGDGSPVFGRLPGEGVVYGWPSDSDGMIRQRDGATGELTGDVHLRVGGAYPEQVATEAKRWHPWRQLARDAAQEARSRPSTDSPVWDAAGNRLAALPGPGVVFRPLAAEGEPVLLRECDGGTGEPTRVVYVQHASRELWTAWLAHPR